MKTLNEALVEEIVKEEQEDVKLTSMDKQILDATKELNIPENIKLDIINDFRKMGRKSYFARYKTVIPKYLLAVAPKMKDYTLSQLAANPQIMQAYYDRNYKDVVEKSQQEEQEQK